MEAIALVQIAAGADGMLYGLDDKGKAWVYTFIGNRFEGQLTGWRRLSDREAIRND